VLKRTILAVAALCVAASIANAQDWRPVARQCGEQYAAWWLQTNGSPCASCSGGWPVMARCTAATVAPEIKPAVVEACLQTVNDADWDKPMSHDRIADVMVCLGIQTGK
jgi:hypothetical protein